jgi:hypothetical protein
MAAENSKWFTIVQSTDELLQGDLLSGCPCPAVVGSNNKIEEGAKVDVEYEVYSVAVLTQSCDLVQGRGTDVIVAVAYPFEKLGRGATFMESVRKLRVTALYLLDPVDEVGIKQPSFIVDFRKTFRLPMGAVRDLALSMDRRLRMVPPFRESLSQHYGLYFSRVGLPERR